MSQNRARSTGSLPLEGIAQQGKAAALEAELAVKVGGPEVAAAQAVGFRPLQDPGHHQPEGDGAQQISKKQQSQKMARYHFKGKIRTLARTRSRVIRVLF